MKVLLWGFAYERAMWESAAADGGHTLFFSREGDHQEEEKQPYPEGNDWDVLMIRGSASSEELRPWLDCLKPRGFVVPVGSEAVSCSWATVSGRLVQWFNEYLYFGGRENCARALQLLETAVDGGDAETVPPPVERPFQGICDFCGEDGCEDVWPDFSSYRSAMEPLAPAGGYGGCVGILTHRALVMQGEIQAEKAVARELFSRGILPVLAFHNGMGEEARGQLRLEDAVDLCFCCGPGELEIQVLLLLTAHSVEAKDGRSVYEEAALLFSRWDIPVFHPIVPMFCTRKQWLKDSSPLTQELSWCYITPEMQGMTEPILLSTRDENNAILVEEDRILRFCDRVERYLRLRRKANDEKRIAIILHNSVCAGVEATIGQAFGLDAFQSVVNILNRLKAEGYTVTDIPRDGTELYGLIREKKAVSDFRWTAAEDIVAADGCLHRMGREEYRRIFDQLTERQKESMIETWGEAPGEGMVVDGDIIISGLRFGNVVVMVQPKRGCHKAKCTGEVCKILHDPFCPPPHQYLAAYQYLQRNFDADGCIHVGTEGSLEYLPGKQTGLSVECWPDTVLGALPNFYLYHAGVPGEATPAKRRAYAVLLTYFPAPYGGADETMERMTDLIDGYIQAKDLDNGHAESYRAEICRILKQRPEAQRIMDSCNSFDEGLKDLRFHIFQAAQQRRLDSLHVFGAIPDREEAVRYIEEVWNSQPEVAEYFGGDVLKAGKAMRRFIDRALTMDPTELEGLTPEQKMLAEDAMELVRGIFSCGQELDNLCRALAGRYILPSESGMPDENGRNVLPTGRNMYVSDLDKVPTKKAWERGVQLAQEMLKRYERDEGKLPEQVSLNMTSLDITRSKGELLSQCLYLMGIEPQWDRRGKIQGLCPIPLKELGRPRVDVTVRVTGVLRDSWPEAIALLDDGVKLAASLPEEETENFVRSNALRLERQGRDGTARIFGDPPGSYGAGVDLALMASAWESEEDLMKYYIHYSAWSYGRGRNGQRRIAEFVENIRRTDVSYDVTNTRRMNVLDCGFGTQVQGGLRLIAKHLGGKTIRQYQGVSQPGQAVKVTSLKEQYEETAEATLLNPFWQENIKTQGYAGAAELMNKLQNVFMDQCLNEMLDDQMIDRIAQQCLNADHMQEFLARENPYALEESLRRFLELAERKKWTPAPDVLKRLQESYMRIESDMEEGMTGAGEVQGGEIEIQTHRQVQTWQKQMEEVDRVLDTLK